MTSAYDPLTVGILAITYFGDIVFAISGAVTAMRYRMDVIGVVLIGTITGLGGGTLRDLIIDRPVFWAQDPTEILLCIFAALLTFFFVKKDVTRKHIMVWGDTIGLAAFGVAGSHVALATGVPWTVAIMMGMVTATGGGVIRDVITNTQPMIMSGQLYATAALLGATVYTVLFRIGAPEFFAEFVAFAMAFCLRAAAIVFDIRMGPVGEFISVKGKRAQERE